MLLDWIRRQPVKFSHFVSTFTAVVLLYASNELGLRTDVAVGIASAVAAALAWVTAAVVVPTVKLTEATIEKAADMDKADIAKVAEAKK